MKIQDKFRHTSQGQYQKMAKPIKIALFHEIVKFLNGADMT